MTNFKRERSYPILILLAVISLILGFNWMLSPSDVSHLIIRMIGIFFTIQGVRYIIRIFKKYKQS